MQKMTKYAKTLGTSMSLATSMRQSLTIGQVSVTFGSEQSARDRSCVRCSFFFFWFFQKKEKRVYSSSHCFLAFASDLYNTAQWWPMAVKCIFLLFNAFSLSIWHSLSISFSNSFQFRFKCYTRPV